MASESPPSRARSADRLSSIRFISRASGQSFANEDSIGTIECLRAWTRVMRIGLGPAILFCQLTPYTADCRPETKGFSHAHRPPPRQIAIGTDRLAVRGAWHSLRTEALHARCRDHA